MITDQRVHLDEALDVGQEGHDGLGRGGPWDCLPQDVRGLPLAAPEHIPLSFSSLLLLMWGLLPDCRHSKKINLSAMKGERKLVTYHYNGNTFLLLEKGDPTTAKIPNYSDRNKPARLRAITFKHGQSFPSRQPQAWPYRRGPYGKAAAYIWGKE